MDTTVDQTDLIPVAKELSIEVFADANKGSRKHMEDVIGIEMDSTVRRQVFVRRAWREGSCNVHKQDIMEQH